MITEMPVRLKKLRNKLPIKWQGFQGFRGNFSGSPKFITDGHVLLLNSAVLEDVHISQDKDSALVVERSIQEVWHKETRSPSRPAYFIGCGAWLNGDPVALLSDTKTFIYVDPYKLSFCIQAVAADSMEVMKNDPENRPVILYREKNPVAIIMPMRVLEPTLEQRYELVHDPVPISFALSREK
jgi:hypothetical protein